LLVFLVVVAVTVARLRNLFAGVMLFAIFSLLSAALFVVLGAVDVAFTEASVGAGISTILMLATLSLTGARAYGVRKLRWLPLLLVLITGGALVWGTLDGPAFGDPAAPARQHVAARYIEDSPEEIGIPNMVTSVLASYRGYDTLGEVAVIFTAGVAVLGLLGNRRRG